MRRGEGCSVKYWKTYTNNWHPEFQPECLFDAVFGTDVYPNSMLLNVISKTGASTNQELGREAVAALLNASTRVSYEYMVCQVIDKVGSAFNGGNEGIMTNLKNELNSLNGGQHCPL